MPAVIDNVPLKSKGPMILCLYSGGIDSVGMLHKLLTDNKYSAYSIHVHHLNLVNIEKRNIAEKKAFHDTLLYFEENGYRKFTQSESRYDYPIYNGKRISDIEVCIVLGCIFVNNVPNISSIAFGVTKDDLQRALIEDTFIRNDKIVEAISKTGVKRIYPVVDYTKQDIIDFLPEELTDMAWSCRTPIYVEGVYIECGNCNSCKKIKRMVKKVKGNKDVKEIK